MNVLLDTDILIDVALNRLPFADSSSQILEAAEKQIFQAYIAWHTISNFYYIVKQRNSKNFIADLLTFAKVAPTQTKHATFALSLKIADFEDALQVAAAKSCDAEIIVTRNIKHYKKSPVQAQLPQDFLSNIPRHY